MRSLRIFTLANEAIRDIEAIEDGLNFYATLLDEEGREVEGDYFVDYKSAIKKELKTARKLGWKDLPILLDGSQLSI